MPVADRAIPTSDSSAVCETTIEKSTRAMLPFLVVLFLGLMLVALVP